MGSCYSSLHRPQPDNNCSKPPLDRPVATAVPYHRSSNTTSALTVIPEGIAIENGVDRPASTNRQKSVAFNEILNVKQLSPVKTKSSPKRLQRERKRKKKKKKDQIEEELESTRRKKQEEETPSLVSYKVTYHTDFAELVILSSDSEDSSAEKTETKSKLEPQLIETNGKRSKSKLFSKLKQTSKKFFHSKSSTQLSSSGGSGLATDSTHTTSAIRMSRKPQPPLPSRLRPPTAESTRGIPSISTSTSHLPRFNFGFVKQKTDRLNRAVSNNEGIDKGVSRKGLSKPTDIALSGAKSIGNVPSEVASSTRIGRNEFVVNSCDNLTKAPTGSTSTLSSASSGGFRLATRLPTPKSQNFGTGTSSTSGVSTASSNGQFQKSSSSSNISTTSTGGNSLAAPPKLPPKPKASAIGSVRTNLKTTALVSRPDTAHIVKTSMIAPALPTFSNQQQQRLAFLYGNSGTTCQPTLLQRPQQYHQQQQQKPQPTMLKGVPTLVNGNVARSQLVPCAAASGVLRRPIGGMEMPTALGNPYKALSVYNGETKNNSSYPYKRVLPPQTVTNRLCQQEQQQPQSSVMNYYNDGHLREAASGLYSHQRPSSYLQRVGRGGENVTNNNATTVATGVRQSRTAGVGYQDNRRGEEEEIEQDKRLTFDPSSSHYYSPSYVRSAANRLNVEMQKHKSGGNRLVATDDITTASVTSAPNRPTGTHMDSNGNFVTKKGSEVMTTKELGERLQRLALLNGNGTSAMNMKTANMAGNYPSNQLTYNAKNPRTDGFVGGGVESGRAVGEEKMFCHRSQYKCINNANGEGVLQNAVKDNQATSMSTTAAMSPPSMKVNTIREGGRRLLDDQEEEKRGENSNYNEEVNNNSSNHLTNIYNLSNENNNCGTPTSTEELVSSGEEDEDSNEILNSSHSDISEPNLSLAQLQQLVHSNYSATSLYSTASTTSSFYYENHKSSSLANRTGANGVEPSEGGLKKSATNSTNTSQSDSVSNKDFLIDDEIADQPELEFMNLNSSTNNQRQQTEVMAAAGGSRLKRPSYMPLEKVANGGSQSAKTLTPSSPAALKQYDDSRRMLESVHSELDNLISLNSPKNTVLAGDGYFTSLPTYYDETVESSLLSTPTNSGTVVNSPGSSPAAHKPSPMTANGSKLRKRHSYTNHFSSTGPAAVIFRRPRPLSFVEKEDGSIGLGQNSVPAIMQDVMNIKTLLYRLQGELQNAETQNPFESALTSSRFYARQESLDSLHSAGTAEKGSLLSDDSEESTIHLLREEIIDLRQSNRLMKEKLIEKDRVIRLLQQQMAKYTTGSYMTDNVVSHMENTNSTTQTDPCSTGGIDPRALSDGSDGQLVRKSQSSINQ